MPGGEAVVDGAAGEIDGAVAGDVERGETGAGVAAQIGPIAGAGQTDGGAVERERAAGFHALAVVDGVKAGACDAIHIGERGVDEVADAIHDERTTGRVVGADGAAGDRSAEQHGAGGVVEQQCGVGVVQCSGDGEGACGDAVAVEGIERSGVEGAAEVE